MKIRPTKLFGKIDTIIVEDLYDDIELDKITQEIIFLDSKLGDENKTSAAQETGPYGTRRKKRGRGVFLDEVFTDRRFSDILTASRKIFHHPEIRAEIDNLAKTNIYYRTWPHMNFDSTLLQTYANGDYYDYHVDNSMFTAITTFKFYPDGYVGGNLWFRDGDDEVEFEAQHNMMIMFPSIIEHRVGQMFYTNPKIALLPPGMQETLSRRWSVAHLISAR